MPIQTKRNVYNFGESLLVVCQQCSERATLTRHREGEAHIALTCSECGHAQRWPIPQCEVRLESGWRWIGFGPEGERQEGQPACLIPAAAGYGGAAVSLSVGAALSSDTETREEWPPSSLRLWLQTPCEGENLWCFNAGHLDSMERSARASGSFRLEGWVREAEDKEAIFKGIEELRAKLGLSA